MDLLDNPFYILHASPRDRKAQIIDLCERRSLDLDAKICTQARVDLTTPRRRLSIELSWLSGAAPRRAFEIISSLETSTVDILAIDRLSPLARVNLIAAALRRQTTRAPKEFGELVLHLLRTFELVNPTEVCALINEERLVSQFPQVDLATVVVEIEERRRYYGQVLTRAIRNLPKRDLVQAANFIVAALPTSLDSLPILVTDFVNSYEVEMKAFLDERTNDILNSIRAIKREAAAKAPDSTIGPMVEELTLLVGSWGTAANPILQLNALTGKDSEDSDRVFWRVQQLAVDMHNEFFQTSMAQTLVASLKAVFSSNGAYLEQLDADATFLEGSASRQRVNATIGPVMELCEASYASSESDPSTADITAQELISQGPLLLSAVLVSEIDSGVKQQVVNNLVAAIAGCAIAFGNKTEKWSKCVGLLEKAKNLALSLGASSDVITRLEANLSTAQKNDRIPGNLSPISKAPSLHTINGIGFTMVGSDDYDPETKSYTSNYCFVVFGIPVFPITRYRVIPLKDGYRFLGKVPFRRLDQAHFAISLSLLAFFILYFWVAWINDKSQSVVSSSSSSVSDNVSAPSPSSSNLEATPQASQFYRQILSQQIEEGKSKAKEMLSKVDDYDRRLDELKGQLESYKDSGSVDEFNELRPTYNSLVIERNNFLEEYRALVRKVNADVKRYNAGLR